ncbi:MAG TPA: hypothetical protein ENN09_04990 [Planctomycetes bacterium]|nr:hypothetical protein [Planctomycetota bacterium]
MGTPGYQELSRAELLALVEAQERRIVQLEQRIAALEAELARARKDSSNSSKPPSSDLVKPKASCNSRYIPSNMVKKPWESRNSLPFATNSSPGTRISSHPKAK